MRQHSPRLILLAAALACAAPALAAATPQWVGTWATAPDSVANAQHQFAQDTTLRQTVHVSRGGSQVRVVFTNELGAESLTIGGANATLANSTTQPTTAITFSGHPGIVIPRGAVAVSDPIALNLPALSDLTVNLFLPAQTITTLTVHDLGLQTNYEASGNQLTTTTLTGAKKIFSWFFLKDVEVEAPKGAAIVTIGDSITDGAHSTLDANARWPDVLAQRLQSNATTQTIGVLNEGINGNRILHDGWGPNALSRFDHDVLAPAGVKYLILLEGINDIGAAYNPTDAHDIVTAADLIAGISQLARRAHTHGIKIYGATITPYVGAGYASPQGETVREAVNQWIRTTPELDGVIDFDKATRDPANPNVFAHPYDSDDHLHPNDAGYKAMGDSIDLKLFSK